MFTVLPIKEYKENYSVSSDIPVYPSQNYKSSTIHHLRWEKRLSLYPTINSLNTYRTSLYPPISFEITDTME